MRGHPLGSEGARGQLNYALLHHHTHLEQPRIFATLH